MIEERYKYNKEILDTLVNFVENHKEMRFIQALWALNIVDSTDRFFEEPKNTLEKVKESYRVHQPLTEDYIDMLSDLTKKEL